MFNAANISGVKREPITAAAFRVRLAAGSRRSMRAAITACNVRGHVDVGDRLGAQVAAAPADQHIALAEVPDDLLGEERITARTLGDQLGKLGDRPVLPQQLGTQAPASATRRAARGQSFASGAHAQVRLRIPAGK